MEGQTKVASTALNRVTSRMDTSGVSAAYFRCVQGSSVGIATRYWQDGPGIEFQ